MVDYRYILVPITLYTGDVQQISVHGLVATHSFMAAIKFIANVLLYVNVAFLHNQMSKT